MKCVRSSTNQLEIRRGFYKISWLWKSLFQMGAAFSYNGTKQSRLDGSKTYLSLFFRNKQNFLRWYVIMGKIWFHYFTPESKGQSSEGPTVDESHLNRPETQESVAKVMAWNIKFFFYFWISFIVNYVLFVNHRIICIDKSPFIILKYTLFFRC